MTEIGVSESCSLGKTGKNDNRVSGNPRPTLSKVRTTLSVET